MFVDYAEEALLPMWESGVALVLMRGLAEAEDFFPSISRIFVDAKVVVSLMMNLIVGWQ